MRVLLAAKRLPGHPESSAYSDVSFLEILTFDKLDLFSTSMKNPMYSTKKLT